MTDECSREGRLCLVRGVSIRVSGVALTLHHRLRRRDAAPEEEAAPTGRRLRSAEAAAPRLTEARTVREEARTPREAGAKAAVPAVMTEAILDVVEWLLIEGLLATMPIGRGRRASAVTSASEATALANARLNAVVTERVAGDVSRGERAAKRFTRSTGHFSDVRRAWVCVDGVVGVATLAVQWSGVGGVQSTLGWRGTASTKGIGGVKIMSSHIETRLNISRVQYDTLVVCLLFILYIIFGSFSTKYQLLFPHTFTMTPPTVRRDDLISGREQDLLPMFGNELFVRCNRAGRTSHQSPSFPRAERPEHLSPLHTQPLFPP